MKIISWQARLQPGTLDTVLVEPLGPEPNEMVIFPAPGQVAQWKGFCRFCLLMARRALLALPHGFALLLTS